MIEVAKKKKDGIKRMKTFVCAQNLSLIIENLWSTLHNPITYFITYY